MLENLKNQLFDYGLKSIAQNPNELNSNFIGVKELEVVYIGSTGNIKTVL